MRLAAFAALLLLTTGCQQSATAEEVTLLAPAPTRASQEQLGLKTAIFAGGCYWGVEGVFSHINGVTSVVSGFHGGAANTAEYERISRGDTGHAESVRVTFDPTKVRYDQLLRVYFSVVADPTQLNRQGPDTGTQYRSALVPMDADQQAVASAYIAQLSAARLWKKPIVTRIESFRRFYPAETYHQDFIAKNPNHPYIVAWDLRKIEALRKLFPGLYKARFTTG